MKIFNLFMAAFMFIVTMAAICLGFALLDATSSNLFFICLVSASGFLGSSVYYVNYTKM